MSKNHRIGIMNGRLSKQIDGKIQTFPIDTWRDEFEKATKCGFELIEWIFDTQKNPIMDKEEIREMEFLSNEFGVKINAVCADYFMEKKLFNVSNVEMSENINMLKDLVNICQKLEIKILEIPLVDSSSLKSEQDKVQLIENLEKILPIAEKNDVKLTLETDLAPDLFKKLLGRFNHPNINANYDTGNSASLGYNIQEELKTFGSWISNIHIKDRKFHGNTVPLGSGNVNFDLFFSELKKINYTGDFIIQGAREEPKIKPENTCKKYLDFVKRYIEK